MKFLKLLFALCFLVFLGGFGYFAFSDVTIQQETVTKEIPNERLLQKP